MRPLFLSLEHFGPFRERQDIDFSSLDDFFLVCGQTGSGKTTIFDAITYALFGETVGGRSNLERELPSRFSPEGSRPWVELTFSADGQIWKVQRVLPYRKRGRDGSERVSAQEATLFQQRPDGALFAVESKPAAVNERISSLLLLGADEFSRIVMLPQGEFQRFLDMKSNQRVEILEKLFDVSNYDRLAQAARGWMERTRMSFEGKHEALERLAAALGPEPEQHLSEIQQGILASEADAAQLAVRIQALSMQLAAIEELRRRWETIHHAEIELERAAQTYAEKKASEQVLLAARTLSELEPLVRETIQRYSEVQQQMEELLQHARRFHEMEAERPLQIDRLSQIAEMRTIQGMLQQRLAVLNLAVEAWQRKAATENQLVEAKARCAQAAEECNAAESALAIAKEEIAALEAKLQGEPEAQSRFRQLTVRQNALIQLQSLVDTLEKGQNQLERVKQESEDLRGREQKACETCNRAVEIRARLQAAAREAQAGMFAAALKEGEPCPVCGSLQHPRPAAMPQDIPNPAALEEAQRNVETAQAALSVIQEKVSAQRAQLARLEADCAEGAQRIIAWLAENPGLVNQAEEGQIPNSALCRAQAEEYQRQLSTLHAALDDYARQREQLGVLRLRHERALAALDEKRSEYRTLQTRVEALTASLAEISVHAGAVDPGPEKTAQEWKLREAEETIRALEETCRAWESERTESEARFTAQLSMIRRTLPALFQSAETCVQKALSIDALTLLDRMACMEDSSRDGIAGQPLLQLFEALQNAWPSYGTEAVADDARHDMRNAAKTWASVLEEAGFDEQRALDFLKRASASFWPRERIRQAEQDLEQANSALRDARTRVETLREGFMDFLRTNGMDESHTGATLAQTAVQLAAEKSAHETQYQILQNRIAEHKALEARIRDLIAQRVLLQKEYEAAEREFRRADRMAKLLNGELIRGRRLPFKNFILQTVFREITTRASTRLYRMSMGRYLVEPEIQGLSGNQKIGLELAIIDAWNSARRPVGTLSGGEKFMLAISLALGLADSLRERAGANRLESLFIDEGFGSLDTESLSLAISVLDTLRGDRMVAIVSHVEELATRIPSRIVVEKGSEGSRVRIERD